MSEEKTNVTEDIEGYEMDADIEPTEEEIAAANTLAEEEDD